MQYSSPLRLSEEKTMEFIELYKNEECLWNTNIDDYKFKYRRRQAQERIARKLNVPHFDARLVLMKFKNLRNCYSQELKKIAKSVGGSEPVYKPKVRWFKAMEFIKPHLQIKGAPNARRPRMQAINVNVVKEERSDEQEELQAPEEIEEEWVDGAQDSLLQERVFVEIPKHPEGSNSRELSDYRGQKRRNSQNSVPESSSSKKQRTYEVTSQTLNEFTSEIAAMNNDEAPRVMKRDLHNHFGVYVSSLMRTLPMARAVALQAKIVEMISTAIDEEQEKEIDDTGSGEFTLLG